MSSRPYVESETDRLSQLLCTHWPNPTGLWIPSLQRPLPTVSSQACLSLLIFPWSLIVKQLLGALAESPNKRRMIAGLAFAMTRWSEKPAGSFGGQCKHMLEFRINFLSISFLMHNVRPTSVFEGFEDVMRSLLFSVYEGHTVKYEVPTLIIIIFWPSMVPAVNFHGYAPLTKLDSFSSWLWQWLVLYLHYALCLLKICLSLDYHVGSTASMSALAQHYCIFSYQYNV